MTKEELVAFLKESLSITIEEESDYYNAVQIKVQLNLNGEVISEDSFRIIEGD